MRGYTDLVKLLIDEKANVNKATDQEDTPLSLAVWKNHTDTAIQLLEAKASCSRIDRFGDTVLIDASKGGNVKLMKKIIRTKEVDIDHQNKEGLTALMCCAAGNHSGAAKLLLKKKADPELKENRGQ